MLVHTSCPQTENNWKTDLVRHACSVKKVAEQICLAKQISYSGKKCIAEKADNTKKYLRMQR